jgi:hypothetical protein
MIVYAESNFILEAATLQDEYQACLEILELAEAGEVRLVPWRDHIHDETLLDQVLLVIGRQVQTDFGGLIDILCLDQSGDLVLIELKRGRTPRAVTAQLLDYASWVADLSAERRRRDRRAAPRGERASRGGVPPHVQRGPAGSDQRDARDSDSHRGRI